MVMLIAEPWIEKDLIAQLQAAGIDQHDEVWEGVYFVSPIANNEHQDLTAGLVTICSIVTDWKKLGRSFAGVNVSGQQHDWKFNYRVPDLTVFLNGNPAEDRNTHWFGGPDFAVEVVSKNDRSHEKIPFYSRVGVRELLIVDRQPWSLELYRKSAGDDELIPVGRSTLDKDAILSSQILPLTFRLIAGTPRPDIEVTHNDGQQRWLA